MTLRHDAWDAGSHLTISSAKRNARTFDAVLVRLANGRYTTAQIGLHLPAGAEIVARRAAGTTSSHGKMWVQVPPPNG